MKFVFFIVLLLVLPQTSMASQIYMNNALGGPSNVKYALESAYSIGSGVGAKEGRCILCHFTESGGAGQINNGYGQDFVDAAIRLGVSARGGGSQSQQTLSQIFLETQFANQDSDFDGFTNAEEYVINTDPASDIVDISTSPGRGGGGCGSIITPNNFKPTGSRRLFLLFLLFIPLSLSLWLRARRLSHSGNLKDLNL